MELAGRYAIAIGITAIAMAWLGPAGSTELMTVENRFAFWLIAVTVGWLQMIIIARGLRNLMLPGMTRGWVLLLITAALGAVPMTFEVRSLWSVLREAPGYVAPLHIAYMTTFAINVMFCLIQWSFVERWPILEASSALQPVEDNPSQLVANNANRTATVNQLRRRPDGLSGPIVYLSSEDHYLRVCTPSGDGLVLYRMGDAIADLKGADGMQVHRSWWVARSSVAEVLSNNGSRTLVLHNDIRVPVGRTYLSGLRDAGWI